MVGTFYPSPPAPTPKAFASVGSWWIATDVGISGQKVFNNSKPETPGTIAKSRTNGQLVIRDVL